MTGDIISIVNLLAHYNHGKFSEFSNLPFNEHILFERKKN